MTWTAHSSCFLTYLIPPLKFGLPTILNLLLTSFTFKREVKLREYFRILQLRVTMSHAEEKSFTMFQLTRMELQVSGSLPIIEADDWALLPRSEQSCRAQSLRADPLDSVAPNAR